MHGSSDTPPPHPSARDDTPTVLRRTEDRDSSPTLTRRRFFARLSIALGSIVTVLVGVPVAGFFLAPLVRSSTGPWRPVGPVSRFRVGETVKVTFLDAEPTPWSGATAATAAWLRRVSADEFFAYSLNCTHLGCPVRWVPGARLFMCPCHGGVFYEDGAVAAGPPPRALTQYAVRVRNGQVLIRPSALPIT